MGGNVSREKKRLRSGPKARADRGKWPQIEATTLADRVYTIVRHRIMQRELVPGTFIREHEVSGATGVSRTPVREALNRLATQDFLERVPHRGFRVPDRPWEDLLEIYPIIQSLEELAAKLAIDRVDEAALEEMRSLNRKLSHSMNADSRVRVEHDTAFHRILAEASGNSRLAELIDNQRAQVLLLDTAYYSVPCHVLLSVRDHEAIIAALSARNLEATIGAIAANYMRGRQALDEEIKRMKVAGRE